MHHKPACHLACLITPTAEVQEYEHRRFIPAREQQHLHTLCSSAWSAEIDVDDTTEIAYMLFGLTALADPSNSIAQLSRVWGGFHRSTTESTGRVFCLRPLIPQRDDRCGGRIGLGAAEEYGC